MTIGRVVFFFAVLLFASELCEAGLFSVRKTVNIRNALSNKSLNIICKDKHRTKLDGVVLQPGQASSFGFDQSIWENELYYCRFYWQGVNKWFDIFESGHSGKGLCDVCNWDITETGACLNGKKQRVCYNYK